ncbi:TRAP transporter large permease subunit [Microbacteriaceae bacterium K1510]|nr:TRAP transporter large permease subunit [Microbacteriaceae bacterium K1510]
MSWGSILALMFASKVGLLLTALPVAFVFFFINIVGSYLIFGGFPGLEQMVRNEQLSVAQFSLVPIPLFVLMGEVLFHTGLAMKSIDAVDAVIRRVPGRLAVVTLVAGTIFSAISGSTIATTAMLGSLLLPQMLQRNYEPKTAMGPILAIGGVDILIPPSGLAVLLGSLAGISISGLLIGGIVPGLILAALFIGYVLLRCWLNPKLAPPYEDSGEPIAHPWLNLFITVVPLIGVFGIVVISMTSGWATPTESSALGALATVILAACYGQLKWHNLWKALMGTAVISGSLLFIIVGATTFAQLLSFSGATAGLVALIENAGLPQVIVLIGMLAILMILGFFIDQTSIMMITLPFYMPLLRTMGVDLVWFGILYLLCMQIGLLTPPFGLLLFVLKGVAPPGITVGQIYRAAIPYVWLTMLMMAFIFVMPWIVTAFVPN